MSDGSSGRAMAVNRDSGARVQQRRRKMLIATAVLWSWRHHQTIGANTKTQQQKQKQRRKQSNKILTATETPWWRRIRHDINNKQQSKVSSTAPSCQCYGAYNVTCSPLAASCDYHHYSSMLHANQRLCRILPALVAFVCLSEFQQQPSFNLYRRWTKEWSIDSFNDNNPLQSQTTIKHVFHRPLLSVLVVALCRRYKKIQPIRLLNRAIDAH